MFEGPALAILIILALNLWAIVVILRSRRRMLVRLAWIALVLLLPVLGFVIWLFAGPR